MRASAMDLGELARMAGSYSASNAAQDFLQIRHFRACVGAHAALKFASRNVCRRRPYGRSQLTL